MDWKNFSASQRNLNVSCSLVNFFDLWLNGTLPHPNVNVGLLSQLADAQSTAYSIQCLNGAGHKMTRNLHFRTRK